MLQKAPANFFLTKTGERNFAEVTDQILSGFGIGERFLCWQDQLVIEELADCSIGLCTVIYQCLFLVSSIE